MAKKICGGIFAAIAVIVVLALVGLGWAAVVMTKLGYRIEKVGDYDTTIVFIGDSIAEALIGPSPLGERDNYGYYAVLGKSNNFKYYNHSVSGHKTSGGMTGEGSDGLLEMLMREDENATLMKSHLMEADIIDISILGNNILQYNLGLLLLEIADPEFESKYESGNTLINALENGDTVTRPSVEEPGATVVFDFPPTVRDLEQIIARLKELNPTATILFQTVYNPFYEGSIHLHQPVIDELAKITDDGRFGKEGEPIATVAQFREIAQDLLEYLNGMLYSYLDEHEGDFEIIDVNKRFDEITKSDVVDEQTNLSSDCLGRYLIFDDWTHPSNFGHAVIADVTQEKLVELGFANEASAVKNYRDMRLEQLARMYKGVKGFDYDGAVRSVRFARSFSDITLAYFEAIRGYTPIY